MTGVHKTIRGRTAALVFLLGVAGAAAHATLSTSASTSSDTAVNTSQSSETVNLVVGHSVVMNTQVALRRIYVGNPNVLISYTASANEIVVTGKALGTSSLMVWDVNGGSKLYTVEVGADGSAVADALKVEYPKETITTTVYGDHISLSGNVSTKEVALGAEALAKNYSKAVVSSLRVTGHPREVQLKVRFIEVDRSKVSQFGVDILSLGLKSTVGQTGTQQFSSASISTLTSGTTGSSVTANIGNPLNFFLYNIKNNIGASIADLAQQNVLQILAEPTLSAMSGQPASFLSGGEFPFPTIQASAGSTPVVTVSFRPYGIKLDFTPTVNDDNTIRLKVAPEVSSLDYTNAVTISGYSIPALSTRRSQTEVELTPGQSFAISGLLDHQTTEAFARTPGIASIPLLGELFKSKNNSHSVTELVVIITAELVDPMNPNKPNEPTMSVPNLEQKPFDKQMNQHKAADPNTNQDTGKAKTPVAPQNQPVAGPETAASTPAPAAAAANVAAGGVQAAANAANPTATEGVSNPPATMVEPVSSAVSTAAIVAPGAPVPNAPAGAAAFGAEASNAANIQDTGLGSGATPTTPTQMAMQPPAAATAGPGPPSSTPASPASSSGEPANQTPEAPRMHLKLKPVNN